MFLFLESDEEVQELTALTSKKLTGLDVMPLKKLKSMLPVILSSLTALINSLFSRKRFPDCLKNAARVTPLFRKDSMFQASNF